MLRIQGPEEIYAELFDLVQSSHVFGDSKTFVDAVPKGDVATILQKFGELDHAKTATLRSFIEENFKLPERDVAPDRTAVPDVQERIEQLWDVLSRAADRVEPNSSLLALPHPYIVPGGRFREIYYWDSYFTMLGLAEAGRYTAIENMVENFAYLIDAIGFIPNGNRSYFCTRSQPPFFVLMVELLAQVRQDPSIVARYLPQLRREYDFWMQGASTLSENGASTARVVKLGDGYLNRYWDNSDKPRAESYAEDRNYAASSERRPGELFRDIRAACESGWDFSSRWLADRSSLASIRTSEILPVDLNSLLYKLEAVLAVTYKQQGDAGLADFFDARAAQRKELLQTLFFDEAAGLFVDLLQPGLEASGVPSLATAYPLFLEIATVQQAARVADKLQENFLAPGGWLTTLQTSGQQWDKPNGWAPLQWIVFTGLQNYGFTAEADLGATRWVRNNLDVYGRTGRLLEKYDVEQIGALASGGEYVIQDGFGWTNAVLLKFMNHLGMQQ